MTGTEAGTSITEIIAVLLDQGHTENSAAMFLGAFSYELRHRPIVMCETAEGRRDLLTHLVNNPGTVST